MIYNIYFSNYASEEKILLASPNFMNLVEKYRNDHEYDDYVETNNKRKNKRIGTQSYFSRKKIIPN